MMGIGRSLGAGGRDGAGLNKNQMRPCGPQPGCAGSRLCWGIPYTHPRGGRALGASPGFPPLLPARSADVVGISSHVCIENLKLWGFISSGVGDRKGKSNENLLKTENNKFLIFSPSSPTPWSIWIHGPDKQDTLCTWPCNLGLYPGDFTGVKLTTGELFYCSPTAVQTYGGLQVKNN